MVSEPPDQVMVIRQQPGDGSESDEGPVTPGSTNEETAGPVPSRRATARTPVTGVRQDQRTLSPLLSFGGPVTGSR